MGFEQTNTGPSPIEQTKSDAQFPIPSVTFSSLKPGSKQIPWGRLLPKKAGSGGKGTERPDDRNKIMGRENFQSGLPLKLSRPYLHCTLRRL